MLRSLTRPARLISAILFLLLALAATAARAETIRSFESQVRANKDASLDVTETIVYDFEGARRRGIFRDIPITYDRKGGTYSLRWEVEGVSDGDGQARPYKIERAGRDVRIRVGDPDVYLSGVQTYVFRLKLWRAIQWFDDAPEVYWNATGNNWRVPIQVASARFTPPTGTDLSRIKTTSYRGSLGSRDPAQVRVDADSILFYTRDLAPRQNLTMVAALPAASIVKPPAYQGLLWFFADWWSAFTFPILALIGMFNLWRAKGRDIEGGLPAQVEWSPPKDLTPADVGTLIDERCDMTDILSTLIDLAARGYLTIEDLSTKGAVLGIGATTDYAFTRTHQQVPLDAPLRTHESTFLRGLFGTTDADAGRVTLSSLKNQFYVHLPTIREAIYRDLTDKGLFQTNPEKTRKDYIGYGALVGAMGVVALIFVALLGSIAYGLGLVLSGFIVAAFSPLMPAKTALGSRRLRECVGFQRFVRLAEKDRIEKLITDDPTIFGRLLPYAMVLGVGEVWATKFADLMSEAPDWYYSRSGDAFGPYLFVSNLGSGMNEMGTTFASQPSQSDGAGGGSSGFFGRRRIFRRRFRRRRRRQLVSGGGAARICLWINWPFHDNRKSSTDRRPHLSGAAPDAKLGRRRLADSGAKLRDGLRHPRTEGRTGAVAQSGAGRDLFRGFRRGRNVSGRRKARHQRRRGRADPARRVSPIDQYRRRAAHYDLRLRPRRRRRSLEAGTRRNPAARGHRRARPARRRRATMHRQT